MAYEGSHFLVVAETEKTSPLVTSRSSNEEAKGAAKSLFTETDPVTGEQFFKRITCYEYMPYSTMPGVWNEFWSVTAPENIK